MVENNPWWAVGDTPVIFTARIFELVRPSKGWYFGEHWGMGVCVCGGGGYVVGKHGKNMEVNEKSVVNNDLAYHSLL